MVKIKICGITNLEDALAASLSGADAVGFVFYKKSPRYITPLKAQKISWILPKKILRTGVFVNESEKRIKVIAKMCGLHILQFHGNESPDFCRRFKGYKVVKVFRVKDGIDFKELRKYDVFGYLFDSFSKKKLGGTGKKFNWHLLREKGKINKPVFLSGGINIRNMGLAYKTIRPDWIDLSSSVESKPGKKNHAKIKNLINAAKRKMK